MLLDLISLLVVAVIVGGFIAVLRPSMLDPMRRASERGEPVSPRSFAQSGGSAPRSPSRPAPVAQVADRPRRAPRPPIADSAAAPTAEERPRMPRSPMAPVPRSLTPARRIRRQLADPSAVRTALVLREVLDQPVALRDSAEFPG